MRLSGDSLYLPSAFCSMRIPSIFRKYNPAGGPTKLPTLHYGRKQPRIQTEILGHSLVRSLIRSHRSIFRLLRTARFARALRCAHSFARSLTLLTPSLVRKGMIRWLFILCFLSIFDHSGGEFSRASLNLTTDIHKNSSPSVRRSVRPCYPCYF